MMDFLSAHWLDIVTTVLGLAYILLEYKASIWMWLVGFFMQALGIVLYYQNLSMTIYGYWRWVRGTATKEPLPIRHFPSKLVLPWTLLILGVWGIMFWFLKTFTDSTVPMIDSFTTALSIVGIWALAHKYLEQWFIWIVVDVFTCGLYFYKDIPFKASLYALYVVIAVFGFFKWRKMMSR